MQPSRGHHQKVEMKTNNIFIKEIKTYWQGSKLLVPHFGNKKWAAFVCNLNYLLKGGGLVQRCAQSFILVERVLEARQHRRHARLLRLQVCTTEKTNQRPQIPNLSILSKTAT